MNAQPRDQWILFTRQARYLHNLWDVVLPFCKLFTFSLPLRSRLTGKMFRSPEIVKTKLINPQDLSTVGTVSTGCRYKKFSSD